MSTHDTVVANLMTLVTALQNNLIDANSASWATFGVVLSGTIIALFGIGIAWRHYIAAEKQTLAMKENQKKWATMEACEKFDRDPVLYEIRKKTYPYIYDQAADPSPSPPGEMEIDMLQNYFVSLDIGVQMDAYDDDILREQFIEILPRYRGKLKGLRVEDTHPELDSMLERWKLGSEQSG